MLHGLTAISIAGALSSAVASPLLIWIVWQARQGLPLRKGLFLGLLLFESLFLVAYMTFLSFDPDRLKEAPTLLDSILGSIHGLASLVVFIGFWALFAYAVKASSRGLNLFGQHPAITWTAIALRLLSLVSGETIFVYHLVS